MPSDEYIRAFTNKALEALPALAFDISQAIVRKLVGKIVASQQEVAV